MLTRTLVAIAATALILSGCGKRKSNDKPADTSAETRPKSGDDKAPDKRAPEKEPAKEADKPTDQPASAAGDVESIPECAAHFRRVLACPAKGGMSREKEVETRKRSFQAKLDKGTKTWIVKGACEAADKAFKCN